MKNLLSFLSTSCRCRDRIINWIECDCWTVYWWRICHHRNRFVGFHCSTNQSLCLEINLEYFNVIRVFLSFSSSFFTRWKEKRTKETRERHIWAVSLQTIGWHATNVIIGEDWRLLGTKLMKVAHRSLIISRSILLISSFLMFFFSREVRLNIHWK